MRESCLPCHSLSQCSLENSRAEFMLMVCDIIQEIVSSNDVEIEILDVVKERTGNSRNYREISGIHKCHKIPLTDRTNPSIKYV